MNPTTRLQLEELRKEAFKRLESDKHKRTLEDTRLITYAIRSTSVAVSVNPERRVHWRGVLEQIRRDVRTYPIYDCLAMWLDPDAGLAHYEPEVILAIAKELLR